jgi:hypothetical protein
MFRRGCENLKALIIDKEKRVDWLILIIIITLLLFLLLNIFIIALRHGIIGFIVIACLGIFFVLIEILILGVTRKKKLVAALLVISIVPQMNFITLSSDTVSYCMEPTRPYWNTDSWGDAPRKYNGVPVTLEQLYLKGSNPCNIPYDYIYRDHRLRKKYDETGRLFDWFK